MDVEEKLANISLRGDSPSASGSEKSRSTFGAVASVSTGSGHANSDSSRRGLSTESESDKDAEEAKERFMRLVTKARQLTEAGDIERAIKLNEKALAIRFSEKLQKRIVKMRAFLAEQEPNDEEDDEEQMKSMGQGFILHRKLHDKLYSHQKEGVLWMWSLFLLGKGGILADDMGLGKTIQVIAFLAGMFDMNMIKSVMIVVPLSVMPNWLNEFKKWTPGMNVMQFHGGSKKERERALHRVRTRGGVLMTTYGLVVTTRETFAERHGQEFVWDYVILDEGHKIKNPTKTSKSVHHIPAHHRIILTGTPVQNNLKELWSLFDYVHQGSLLGTVRTFKMEFETPIIRARERDASAMEKQLGQEMAATLKSIIQPYFLRRTKAEVSDRNVGKPDSNELKMPSMTRKNDLVIWLHLTETQQQIYQDFINLDHVKELLMTKKSPLVALTVLKKICDHPRLLSTRACLQLGLDGTDFDEEALEQPESYESAVNKISEIADEVLINESGKMQILVSLLDSFKLEGHQTLVFSQSRKLLDIIQKIITNRGHKVARLDGTITQLAERDEIVRKFQKDPSYSVFLLTIQVGGVGLTITAADRVIIYDPNWNPATDAQAVDRVYRIGQQKNVIIYRLITCGTVEEKIYRRQVFKDSITRQTTGASNNPYRYFTNMELRELFTLDDPKFSKTQRQLEELHANQRKSDTLLDEHIAYLHSLDIFGISDHDLMFTQAKNRDDEEDDMIGIGEEEEQNNARLIQHRVQNAQKLIAEESTIPISYEERSRGVMRFPMGGAATYTAPSSDVPAQGGTGQRPSPLFTQVSAREADNGGDNVMEVLEAPDDSVTIEKSNNLVPEVVDLTVADSSEQSMRKEVLSKRGTLDSSPKATNKRWVLQPLSSEEIRHRSPHVTQVLKKGEIIAEELLISPDNHSPIIGLEKINSHRRMMEEVARTGSFPSSPVRALIGSPKSGPRKGLMSPSRLAGSPVRDFMGANKSLSPKASPLRRSLFPAGASATSTPLRRTGPEILVEESPDSQQKTPRSSDGNLLSSSQNQPLDISQACRKLSFVVADSPADSDQNMDKSLQSSPCPVAKKKSKSDFESHQESFTASLLQSEDRKPQSDASSNAVLASQNSLTSDSLKKASRALLAAINSGRSPAQSLHLSSPNKMSPGDLLQGDIPSKTSAKRRSVCTRTSVINDDSSDDGGDKKEDKASSSEGEENVENENVDEILVYDEETEDDKENDPVLMLRLGGRNRLVSESGSESGSCFEVEESEGEEVGEDGEVQSQTGTEEDKSCVPEKSRYGRASYAQIMPIVSPSSSADEGAGATGFFEDLGEDETDEELNQRFQSLIITARRMYKEKLYVDSLLHVEEALQIFYDPDLKKMADKIQLRIDSQE